MPYHEPHIIIGWIKMKKTSYYVLKLHIFACQPISPHLNIQKPYSSDLLNKLKMQGLGMEGIFQGDEGDDEEKEDDDDIECECISYIPHNMNTI